MGELWLPGQEAHKRRVMPTEGKREGGSYFDDELETEESVEDRVQRQMEELIRHMNQRPDHNVYVGSTESRSKMRAAFNVWKRTGMVTRDGELLKLNHNPKIKIEYGVPEDGIRVTE